MSKFRSFITLLSCVGILQAAEPNLTIMVPMRDGTDLPTDVYLPESRHEELPCILIRDPAGRKAEHSKRYLDLVPKGYLLAIQDTRSALDGEGKTLPYLHDGWGEQQDGYDAVEWLAKCPLTNGKIGTLGASAQGITQILMAPSAPPSLKCQHIGIAAASLYHHVLFPGGQLRKEKVEGWLSHYAHDPSVHGFVVGQPFLNEFWEGLDARMVADQVEVPGLHYGGWYDTFIQGTIDCFVTRQDMGAQGAKGKQKLLIGPWSHFWPASTHFGDFAYPAVSNQPPVDISAAAWFDFHLKDQENSIDTLPVITYYVMGPFDGSASSGNVWRHANQWPVPAAEKVLFLSADGKMTDSPTETYSYSYKSDPKNPVPTIGGNNLFLESGPKCQKAIEKRDDVLVFTSEPLEEDLEVTGQIHAKVFFSSDCQDTDIALRLTDVYPDGRSVLISDGIYRTGKPGDQCDPLEPHEVTIDLWSTSMVFAKGHSIRILIAGSNYPRYERNLNVGHESAHKGEGVVAKHIVHTGSVTPSRILLPVVRQGDQLFAQAKAA